MWIGCAVAPAVAVIEISTHWNFVILHRGDHFIELRREHIPSTIHRYMRQGINVQFVYDKLNLTTMLKAMCNVVENKPHLLIDDKRVGIIAIWPFVTCMFVHFE